MERDQFTFYRSFWEALKVLPKKDRLPFVTAICTYVFEGESKSLTGQASASFLLVKPILDKASKKAANGKRGGSKPKANLKQTESNIEGEIEVEGEVEREEENENDSYIPPTPSATEGAAKNYWGFDQFWDVYPKKSAKKDAFDAWKRVDPDEGKVKRILEAVKRQKLWPQYSGENARYFPSPSKWLDGGCWDDEPLAGEEDPYAKFT